jgi:hypothetical protein
MIGCYLKAIDWGKVANIATSIGLLLAIIALIYQIVLTRKTQEQAVFLKLLDAYETLLSQREDVWPKIKESVRANPKTQREIPDRGSSVDYLLQRIGQPEPMYAVEYHLIELELQSLNILNEICSYSLKDEDKAILTKALYSSEISFYKNNLQNILRIRDHASKDCRLSVPRYDALMQFEVDDFFSNKIQGPK